MEKKKSSWLKRSLLGILGLAAGCATAAPESKISEPDFVRKQTTKPAAIASANPSEQSKEEKKNQPFKMYIGASGLAASEMSKAKGNAKIVISPTEDMRIPAYLSGSWAEYRNEGEESLISRVLSGGVGFGYYFDASKDVRVYADATVLGEGVDYSKSVDIDLSRAIGVGRLGLMSKNLDLKLLLTAGGGKGDYEGIIGTAQLEDITTKWFANIRGKFKLFGEGNINGFEDENEDIDDSQQESGKEKGLYGLLGAGYANEEFKGLVQGDCFSGIAALELRDELNVGNSRLPYFVRIFGTARQETYDYPHSKDKLDNYFGAGVRAGIKIGDHLWLIAEGGYDGEQYGYGSLGAQFSFGLTPKKKKK